ncbi:MAG: acyl-CoA thioesterase [Arenimonas sp.]
MREKSMSEKSVQLTEARLLEMVFPHHTNHLGTLFGGQALAWMDKAAFIAASRYARRTVVTARSEQVDFRIPVRQGQLVEVVARVAGVGRTSMQVEVQLFTEDLLDASRELCTSGRFVMIALDSSGEPARVNALLNFECTETKSVMPGKPTNKS